MEPFRLFLFEKPSHEKWARGALGRMPALTGGVVRIVTAPGLCDRRGPVHAGSFLRERRIAFDCGRAEFPRILVHEVAHFIWLRLGNKVRHGFEEVLRGELGRGIRGELGWSAEWRKAALGTADIEGRSRRWREYCCESFCDTSAWRYSGIERHAEFTLGLRQRRARREWFDLNITNRALSI